MEVIVIKRNGKHLMKETTKKKKKKHVGMTMFGIKGF